MTRAYSLLALLLCALLLACGGGSDPNSADSQWDDTNGRLVGGIANVNFLSEGTTGNSSTSSDSPTSGMTDVAGKFTLGIYQQGGCFSFGNDGTQTCATSGAATYAPTIFTLCGAALPGLQPPAVTAIAAYQTPAYTAYDLFPTLAEAENWAAVALMANTNTGDPTKTGINISSALQRATCPAFSWANIQPVQATMLAAANGDGLTHNWPTTAQVTSYLTTTYQCARSGVYLGLQQNTATSAYAASSLSGYFGVIVDFDGQAEGSFDFSRSSLSPYTESVAFSGPITVQQGGVGTLSYTAPSSSPYPNMSITLSLLPYGGIGAWQTADGSAAGTTASTSSGQTNPGLSLVMAAPFPKYRFFQKNVQYTAPGTTTAQTYVLTTDVGYDSKVSGMLQIWPAAAWGQPGLYLEWTGTMSGNTVTLQWTPQQGVTTSTKTSTLTFDQTTTTLTGTFNGLDGNPFLTFTSAQPLQGCRQ